MKYNAQIKSEVLYKEIKEGFKAEFNIAKWEKAAEICGLSVSFSKEKFTG